MIDLDKDKLMWIGIRSGLLGLKKAIEFSTFKTASLGIASSALGRIITAIEERWELSRTEEKEFYDRSHVRREP